ncbi:MAG: SGNH/GDSL hydrolase family protein [Pseudomonadota bacterium]|nr:SGNH/GDSL hydrolase family protein [Pseudomonadota bacterium]
MVRAGLPLFALLAGLFTVPASAELRLSASCPDIKLPPIALPKVRRMLAAGQELTIVAFGSSTTQGSHATDMRHTYPAILQLELEAALPDAHVAVINRGVGGQDAPEMMARLDTDVLALRPTLVIWQVGANGAMRGSDPSSFTTLVDAGVRKLEQSGADVILMDNQRSPAVLASPQHAQIDQALADVAQRDDARLFARGRLMELWKDAGHPYAEFLADDGIHHNDRGYACIAKALAQSMLEGLGPMTRRLSASQ